MKRYQRYQSLLNNPQPSKKRICVTKEQRMVKPLLKNSPPHMKRFPPPCVDFLRGNGRRPDQSHLLKPPKLGLEGVIYSTFSAPESHDTFCLSPPVPFPNKRENVRDVMKVRRQLRCSWRRSSDLGCFSWQQ